MSLDHYEIEGKEMVNWNNLIVSDPIPSEYPMPSDIRFRKDLTGSKKDKKRWKGPMMHQ
jgi:hypothetical protein